MKLIELINKQLEVENKKYKSPIEPALKPSSMGYNCLRRLYYDFYRVVPDREFSGRELMIFKTGSNLHEMLQGLLGRAGALIMYFDQDKDYYELEFVVEDRGLCIKKGKVDGIIKCDGKLHILEIKTINSRKFKDLTRPLKEHTVQGEIYRYLFVKCLNEGKYKNMAELDGFTGVESVIYLYLCKDTGEMKEFEVAYDESVISEVIDKVATFLDFALNKVLPPKNKDECYFCTFKNKCSKDFNPVKE